MSVSPADYTPLNRGQGTRAACDAAGDTLGMVKAWQERILTTDSVTNLTMVLWSRAQLSSGRGIQLSAKQLIVRQARVDLADLSACATSEMALRDFVTGSDMCTPDEGAGPSNAAATLANSLLGRSAKDQERLREVNMFLDSAVLCYSPCQPVLLSELEACIRILKGAYCI